MLDTVSEQRVRPPVRDFDRMIGELDRALSEFLLAVDVGLDEADIQTLKHHADDLIGVGRAALERIERRREAVERVERGELPF